jgi:hypothetical protein
MGRLRVGCIGRHKSLTTYQSAARSFTNNSTGRIGHGRAPVTGGPCYRQWRRSRVVASSPIRVTPGRASRFAAYRHHPFGSRSLLPFPPFARSTTFEFLSSSRARRHSISQMRAPAARNMIVLCPQSYRRAQTVNRAARGPSLCCGAARDSPCARR